MKKTFFIKTFGCQHNIADSERIAKIYILRGYKQAKTISIADVVIINSCMVRQSAENRVYGLVNNLSIQKKALGKPKIIVTGCMVGLSSRDKTGKYIQRLKNIMPLVDEFLPIEEVGYEYEPLRRDKTNAWVPISNGCNNYCSFCVVPFTRGREVSRPFDEIVSDCKKLLKQGYQSITLLGQNVNSYGADIVAKTNQNKQKRITFVKHLGRNRIPTLFPALLSEIASLGFSHVDFISSNPWDFSNDLIKTIKTHKNITRTIHLPVQSGDDLVLKRMNRWYTAKQYLNLVKKIKKHIPEVVFTTDIIVGFPGETEKQFQNTVKLAKKIGFKKAYISIYSERPFTYATKHFQDDIPHKTKKRRWLILEQLINKN